MSPKFTGANQLVETQLGKHLAEIEGLMGADCLTYFGPIAFGADDDIRDAVETIDNKQGKLVFILETLGGFAETARRIADTLRHHYGVVDFLVPGYAMSAGTILAMSGDAIHMDYYSILGPIDPQKEGPDGNLIPALGYVVRYNELLKKANKGKVSQAEMEILLSFDQGELYAYEQARDLSRSLLEEWLCKYKWKNWTTTETRKLKVTDAMKRKRAREIASKLNDVKRWQSHGLGINMKQLKEILNLRIDDFGQQKDLNHAVRRYHKLLTDYMSKMRHRSVVQTREDYIPLISG
jgi:membrane-bound ClpP family serine protease